MSTGLGILRRFNEAGIAEFVRRIETLRAGGFSSIAEVASWTDSMGVVGARRLARAIRTVVIAWSNGKVESCTAPIAVVRPNVCFGCECSNKMRLWGLAKPFRR